ncbi:hypothetical protein V5O48_007031 [Marasmius crinis-equi]|uniref:F-box domain-containing protein n=1 Tax=Marasmius crinis-equi TaxID=585013 RepID=A0ABR3FHT0_9AGAR
MESLPTEVLQEICYCIGEGRTLKRFRLGSKRINEVVERCLWETRALVIHLNREELRSGMEMLEDLKNRCKTSGYVRALRIESLAPLKVHRYETERQRLSRRVKTYSSSEQDIIVKAWETLTEVLPMALSSLSNLQLVQQWESSLSVFTSWRISYQDLEFPFKEIAGGMQTWRHTAVLEPLSRITELKTLALYSEAPLGIPLPPLRGFRHLESLTIGGNWAIDKQTVETNLSPMLYDNPNLTSLSLRADLSSPDFSLLFPSPKGTGPRLRHLHLEEWNFTVTPTVLPHLRHLRSLELPYGFFGDKLYDTIWPPFQGHAIHLTQITVNVIDSQFLDYMESFSGLEVLVIKCYTENELASRLYEVSLPKHRDTLHTIELTAWDDQSELAIGLPNSGTFSSYEKLVSLSVVVLAEDIKPGQGLEHDVVTSLITSLLHLRHLTFLKICGVMLRGGPNIDPADTVIMESARRRAVESLERFRFPKEQLQYADKRPQLLVSTLTPNGHYLVESKDEEGMLVFVRENSHPGNDSFYYYNIENPTWHEHDTDNSDIA